MTKMTGSLTNRLMERATIGAPEPTIGMGATECGYSDREPYTIIEIKSANRIIVQADKAKRIDLNGMSDSQQYEYSADPEGYKVELIRTKRGWKEYKGSTKYAVGHRQKYFDYSF